MARQGWKGLSEPGHHLDWNRLLSTPRSLRRPRPRRRRRTGRRWEQRPGRRHPSFQGSPRNQPARQRSTLNSRHEVRIPVVAVVDDPGAGTRTAPLLIFFLLTCSPQIKNFTTSSNHRRLKFFFVFFISRHLWLMTKKIHRINQLRCKQTVLTLEIFRSGFWLIID